MKRSFILLALLLLLAGGGVGVYVLFHYYENIPPEASWVEPPEVVGREAFVGANLSDKGMGLREAVVEFVQGSVTKEVFRQTFPGPPEAKSPLLQSPVEIRFASLEAGGKDGRAKIVLTVFDRSWKNGKKGNRTVLELNVTVSTRPPRGEVLTTQHNVFQGGTELVIYRALGGKIVETGVKVGDRLFPGHLSPIAPETYAAFFAIPYSAPPDVKVAVWIKDSLGNFVNLPFYYHILPKRFRTDTVKVTPEFIQKIRSEYGLDPSLSDVDAFLSVNRDERKKDHEKIRELCKVSKAERLWKGTFRRMLNAAPKANFAEHRTYLIDGKPVDEQDHLGSDLASLANSPVTPANSGVIVYAGDLGIYGNAVLIDHGLGVFTLYGHLSSVLAPDAGQPVTPETVIGRTGTTGLALGDHLHYGVLLYGEFVNPIEWWDPLWIGKHIEPKLKLFEEAPPAAPTEGEPTATRVPPASPSGQPAGETIPPGPVGSPSGSARPGQPLGGPATQPKPDPARPVGPSPHSHR